MGFIEGVFVFGFADFVAFVWKIQLDLRLSQLLFSYFSFECSQISTFVPIVPRKLLG